jgi:translation initiation factor 2 subunit 3
MVTQAGNPITVDLKLPVCAEEGDRIAISRRFSSRWRLIGGGTVKNAE